MDQSQRKLDQFLSTRFNILNLINPTEEGISDIIADLFRSDGTHGQSTLFLREFFALLNRSIPRTNYEVIREAPTNFIDSEFRKLDILIDFGDFGFAIENKPWSQEQQMQIHDSVAHLRKRFEDNFLIVFLSQDGRKPKSIDENELNQLMSDQKLVLMKFTGQFSQWIRACRDICNSDRFRYFLQDFNQYLSHNL